MKINCEIPIQEMSFWQLVFRKCLSGFVCFSKKYIWEMSIRRNTFEVTTVNPHRHSQEICFPTLENILEKSAKKRQTSTHQTNAEPLVLVLHW